MATRKPTKKVKSKSKKVIKVKKPAPKRATKPAPKKKVAPKKKPVAPKKKAIAKKPARKPTGPRDPPMHAKQLELQIDPPAHERDETFEIFKSFDRDGSSSIDRAELSRLLEALGQQPGEDELVIALSVIDANDSGRISWDEFKAWWSNR
jgi:hypothetical protein